MNFYAEIKCKKEDLLMNGIWIDKDYEIKTFEDNYLIRGGILPSKKIREVIKLMESNSDVLTVQFDVFGMVNENWNEFKEPPIRKIDIESPLEDILEYLSYHKKLGYEISEYEKWIQKSNEKMPFPIIRKMICSMGDDYGDLRNPYEGLKLFVVKVNKDAYDCGNTLYNLGYKIIHHPQINQDLFILGKEEGKIEELSSLEFVEHVREEGQIRLGKLYD